MAVLYPVSLDNFSTAHRNADPSQNISEAVNANDINDLANAINTIERILGINPHQGRLPAGVYTDLVSRLNAIDAPAIKNITPPYQIVAADIGSILNCNNSVAANITIPANATLSLPTGITVVFRVVNAAITFVPASGVTLSALNNSYTSGGQWGMIAATKVATDIWALSGALA